MPFKSQPGLGQSFDPKQVELMQRAFDTVWARNGISISVDPVLARQEIAAAIVRAASRGEPNLEILIDAGEGIAMRLKAPAESA